MYDQIVDVLINLYGERDAAFESYRVALRKNERKAIANYLNGYHEKKKQIDRVSGVFVDESQKALQEYNREKSTFQKQIQ